MTLKLAVSRSRPSVPYGANLYICWCRKRNEDILPLRQKAAQIFKRAEGSLMSFYVSRQWISKFNTFAEPGPISNNDFLCLHGGKLSCLITAYSLVSGEIWPVYNQILGACWNLETSPRKTIRHTAESRCIWSETSEYQSSICIGRRHRPEKTGVWLWTRNVQEEIESWKLLCDYQCRLFQTFA